MQGSFLLLFVGTFVLIVVILLIAVIRVRGPLTPCSVPLCPFPSPGRVLPQ